MEKIILPTITTAYNPNWFSMIEEVSKLGLDQIALFLTVLDFNARQKCFGELEKIPVLKIPFVHARSDMVKEEYEYLMYNFGTKKFNLHPLRDIPSQTDLSTLKEKIYIETGQLYEKDLAGFAGICLDLSHLELFRITDPESYKRICILLNKYPVGVNHISAVSNDHIDDIHTLSDLSELNYLKKYPEKYFGEYVALELTNPLFEQLEIKKHLQTIFPFLGR